MSVEIEICESCKNKIPFVKESVFQVSSTYGERIYYDEVIYVCEYSGIVKEAIIRYKFFEKALYYRAFGKLLSEKVKEMTNIKNFDIIISVPLHKERQHSRGYNQSALLTKVLSRETGIPQADSLLKRVVNTGSQSKLGKIERQTNVEDAFNLNNQEKVKGKSILLVDDIFTTGNTINECSKLLKAAGAKIVVAALIASGRKTFTE